MPFSILQIASGFPNWGGTELHILNLSEQLRLRGHDVTVACRPGCWVEERAGQMGLPTVPIRVMKQMDFRDFGPLRRLVRERGVDVLHAHWSRDAMVSGMAGVLEHIPVRILSRHMPYPFKTRLAASLYSQFLFTRLVAVSDSVRRTLEASGVPASRVEVIHHGTDVSAFAQPTLSAAEARQSLNIPQDHVAIGIIGRIAPEKGHYVLLQAAQALADRYPLRFVVVGSGPDEAKLQGQVREMGLAEYVLFAGFRDDVNNVLSALDIVTVPSTWNEPCSAVVQQAMAASKPVIGTRVGGTPEMIRDGENGLLVPPGDAAALADALARLAGDAFCRRRLGAAGHALVEAEFSLRAMTDKIEDLYSRLTEEKCGASPVRKALA